MFLHRIQIKQRPDLANCCLKLQIENKPESFRNVVYLAVVFTNI